MILIVQCKQCGLWINAESGQHPNAPDLLRCGCCTVEHDHDTQAEETGTPCRPINITLVSPVHLQLGIGQPQSTILADGMEGHPTGLGVPPDDVPAVLSRGNAPAPFNEPRFSDQAPAEG